MTYRIIGLMTFFLETLILPSSIGRSWKRFDNGKSTVATGECETWRIWNLVERKTGTVCHGSEAIYVRVCGKSITPAVRDVTRIKHKIVSNRFVVGLLSWIPFRGNYGSTLSGLWQWSLVVALSFSIGTASSRFFFKLLLELQVNQNY